MKFDEKWSSPIND